MPKNKHIDMFLAPGLVCLKASIVRPRLGMPNTFPT